MAAGFIVGRKRGERVMAEAGGGNAGGVVQGGGGSQLRKEGEDEDPAGGGGGYKWMVGQPVWESVMTLELPLMEPTLTSGSFDYDRAAFAGNSMAGLGVLTFFAIHVAKIMKTTS
uniref:Uncharacterized protein n=1 Tax=Salix viminalis TaxID=40686 RepID=A0A6N2N7S4_SALVM